MKTRLLSLLLASVLACQSIAAGLPDLGDVGASDLSPLAERRVGEQAMRDIRWHAEAYLEDPEVEDYLNALGLRLASLAPGSSQDFSFFAVRDDSLNAFALPGGFIGVHTGLITAAQSESELASVLGHEIAHVTQRHIAQLVGSQGQTGLIMLASIIVAVLAASSNPQAAEAALATGSAAGIQSQLSYSRDFEREADRVGLQILDGAGFDVRGMGDFFERLQRNSRLYENNAPVYMRTHPLTTERIADIGNRIQHMRYRQAADSLDFRLVRAKLVVDAGPAAAAMERLHLLASEPAAVRSYARSRALYRTGRVDEATAELATGAANGQESPLIAALRGELLREGRRWPDAVVHYRRSIDRFPAQRALVYGLVEAMMGAGRYRDAVAELRERIGGQSEDPRLWSMLARSQAEIGSSSGRHRAQAEVYRIRGALRAAVEQLELARAAGDADFYDGSAIDSRLREMRQELKLEREAARAGGNR